MTESHNAAMRDDNPLGGEMPKERTPGPTRELLDWNVELHLDVERGIVTWLASAKKILLFRSVL